LRDRDLGILQELTDGGVDRSVEGTERVLEDVCDRLAGVASLE
jgi:hypothetical protein